VTPTRPEQPAPPGFILSAQAPHEIAAEAVAVPVWRRSTESADGADGAGAADALVVGPGAADLAPDLLDVLELSGATGAAGEITTHVSDGRRVLLVGVGAQGRDDFRRAGAALARATRGVASLVTTVPALAPDLALEPFVAGVVLGSFTFAWRAAGPATVPVAQVTLAELDPATYADGLRRATAIAEASWQARFLASVPANVKSPAWLADRAVEAGEAAGLTVRVWDEEALVDGGFGGILGVGSGSATPPRMVRLDYAPRKAGRKTPTVALVGKGITFDTGGYNLKPGDSMGTMKRDMTGAGVVLAVMCALAAVECPVRVVGLMAIAENSVSGSAMRPGDVLRHYGGRTSEVGNTDAEGRLVLADAMAYAVDQVEPDVLVDIATLTGAMKVALGQTLGGYFATTDTLAAALAEAAEVSGEALWRMPLAEVYEEKLTSKIADADNAPGGPGAVTAALFLRHFTGGLPWAHLDVASVGDAAKDEYEWTPGPTGFGARVLLEWLSGPRF
jgi:leucyl aminopeptidase